MSDVFREVDEDLRHERLRALWDRYGIFVLGAAVLIVALTAGWRGWVYWEESRAAASGDRYMTAFQLAESGKAAEAETALAELAKEGSGGYPALARMRLAAVLASSGKVDAAVAAYEEASRDPSAPILLRDVARLRAGLLLVDRVTPEEMTSRIGDLAETGRPFRHTARELIGLAAMRTGDTATARRMFEEILADLQAPASIRQRGQVILDLIAARGAGPSAPKPQ